MSTAFILLTDSLNFTDKAEHINILHSILLHRLGYGGELLRQIRLPLMTATDIVDHVESTTYLMEVEECRELVKEALHYHCLPPRQSILQVPNVLSRCHTRKKNQKISKNKKKISKKSKKLV